MEPLYFIHTQEVTGSIPVPPTRPTHSRLSERDAI
jgi:hypothetical protein